MLRRLWNWFRPKCCFCGKPGNLFAYSDYHLECWWEATR